MLVKNSFIQTVKNYMNKNVPKLYSDNTIRDAVEIFRKDKIMILPVMDKKNSFSGIMTPSSIFKAFSENVSIDENILPFIVKDAVTVNENDNLTKVRLFLKHKKVGQAVVLSDDNQVAGVLDTKNIIQAYQSKYESLGNSLESLFQHMQTGIMALDHNGTILITNHAAETLCKLSKEQSIGFHYTEVLPQLTNISSGDLTVIDIQLHRISIKDKRLLITYKSLSNESNDWGGIILIQDLTDYEQIANELEITKKLERTLQTVLDTTYDGYIVINQSGIIEMFNDAACEFVRKTKNNLVGQPVTQIIPEIKLEEALAQGFQSEKLEAMIIGKHRCFIQKTPIYKGKQLVGAIAKIIYKDLNKWKNVVKILNDLEKEVSFYRGELSLIGGKPFDLDDILTQNEEMGRIKHFARQSATGFSNVLLLGDSGTGKELFARGIHNASHRTGKFIKINCAAIPEELWESEFFGYADGAFTGAKRGGKPGKFELANNGTLFLDEIGDMPLSMQVKLLRVLQEREFERVGGNDTIRVNVRIIAATNKDLKQMVANNEFREDLYYRLNVIVINIPPLKDRSEDIPILTKSITKKFSHLMGLGEVNITEGAMKLLSLHSWPGNVRELENAIERAMNCIRTDIIDIEHLPEYIQKTKAIRNLDSPPHLESTTQEVSQEVLISDFYKNNIDKAEKDAIDFALKQTGGNRTAAAKLLGMSRSQFYKKFKKSNSN
ncbi:MULTISPECIES: sigma-54-dependent Fis family transcriptional regulator [Peribacillus]|uniref:sigma-54-dependent Fis family transcriptional regulator n=1 Tax=Peribacillus TaxID=2675229 RepID=UPI001F4DBD56|nr:MULTISPECIES: sigma-54-dependent Fis family transcriptional regulator [unclassified Peribacillus]MCK1983555.1 sigma 54-interacting transcriptional regulator [Peribacillus sp. Aquil_B1]MCK2006573.1 sigma 54-interacting transcriptional regulator [Peribacillus sp. Aquil_B8]